MSLTIAIASSLLTISISNTVLLLASPDRESHCPDIDLFVSSPSAPNE